MDDKFKSAFEKFGESMENIWKDILALVLLLVGLPFLLGSCSLLLSISV